MSGRVLRAIAPYGLGVPGCERTRASGEYAPARVASALVDRVTDRGGVVLITGPSGAGKSSLLRAIESELGGRGCGFVRADRARVAGDRPVAGLAAATPIDEWLGCLSLSGLADARLFATRARDLSVGETARLQLALAFARLARSGTPEWMVCDEFCSVLDRATAAGVASALRRWATASASGTPSGTPSGTAPGTASGSGARVVVASAHADLVRLLGPDVVVRVEPGGGVSVEAGPGRTRAGRVSIGRGTIDDFRTLGHHHYRGGRPASVARVLRATVPDGAGGRRLAGVLVVSHPTLNGAWREMAWPGRYVGSSADRGRLARRLNREVRRISRVVVDPRDRGRGIARRLVRAYVDDPLTPATEAISTMGRLSPFGRSAGMTEYRLPPRPADDRLADMLDAMGLASWELLDGFRMNELRRGRDGAWLARELGVWARAVRASVPKPMRGAADPFVYAGLAAGRLCAPPIAYAHAW